MAGYSTTPLPRKLGLKAGMRVGLHDAPDDFDTTLGPLPEGVVLDRGLAQARYPVQLCFVTWQDELAPRLAEALARMPPDGSIWVAWPKKSSKRQSDMREDLVRQVALPVGVVDNKVCAIDDTWSGLRLVVRREQREGWDGVEQGRGLG